MDAVKKLVSARLKAPAVGPHPDPELLAALAENSLPHRDRADLLKHLATCIDCRDILYLALPDMAEAQQLVAVSRKQPRFAWRWATLAASIVIVGSVIVSNRHMFTEHPTTALESRDMAYPASPPPKEPSEADQLPSGVPAREARAKARPEAKHMTAKPQSSMTFDQSDEVHVAAAAAPAALNEQKVAANQVQPAARGQAVQGRAARDEVAQGKDRQFTAAQDQRTQTRQLLVAPSQRFDTYSAGNLSSKTAFSWSLTPAGQPQRSLDLGRSWQVLPVKNGPFLVIQSVGLNDVWIGGSAGSLYHSSDAGQNWAKIVPTSDGKKLESDVKEINFTDPLNGTVTTVSGEIWSTSDSGKNWQLK